MSNKKTTLLKKITKLFSYNLRNKKDFIELLNTARKHRIIDKDSFMMIEGVFKVTQSKVRDVMIPRTKVVSFDMTQSIEKIIKIMSDSAHSRYPVFNESKDKIVGILLAKDILDIVALNGCNVAVNLSQIYRKPTFVSESKRLNFLLRDFKVNKNHMAMVVDEYGDFSGLITMEDVLEQIVGDIEDEHDEESAFIQKYHKGGFVVQGIVPIAEFNKFFKTTINVDMETIGGVVAKNIGQIPKEGETIQIEHLLLKAIKSNHRVVKEFIVQDIAKVDTKTSNEVTKN